MPNLTNNEFDELMSEYAHEQNPGEKFFKEMDAQIYQGISFDELPTSEQVLMNLFAETAEEVLAEHEAEKL